MVTPSGESVKIEGTKACHQHGRIVLFGPRARKVRKHSELRNKQACPKFDFATSASSGSSRYLRWFGSQVVHGQRGTVPDDVILALIKERIQEPDATGGLMFDGFPRTIPQAQVSVSSLRSPVLAIDVPDERIVERICGRSTCGHCGAVYHDTFNPFQPAVVPAETTGKNAVQFNETTVMSRLGAYHEQTSPLAEWYEKRGLFHRVNGDRNIDQVRKTCRCLTEWTHGPPTKRSLRRSSDANVPKPFKIISLNSFRAPVNSLRNSRTRLLSSSNHLEAPPSSTAGGQGLVCRKCWSAHHPSTSLSCANEAGQRIKTCLSCGTVRRFGGGQASIGALEGGNGMAVPNHIISRQPPSFRPSVRVGKSGLSETLIEEIRQQLASRQLVKIKVNKGLFEQRSRIWSYLANETGSVLVLQRGNIGVLWRR